MSTVKGEVEVAVSSDTERVRKRRLLLASVAKKAASWATTEPSSSCLVTWLTASRTRGRTTGQNSSFKPWAESEQRNRAIRVYGAGLSILGAIPRFRYLWPDLIIWIILICWLAPIMFSLVLPTGSKVKGVQKTLPHDSERNCTYLVTCLTASSTRYRTTCLMTTWNKN